MPELRVHTFSQVETGRFELVPTPDAEMGSEEWKRAVLLAVLVERAGGTLTIGFNEVVSLKGTTLQIFHDHYNDTLILRVK